MIASQFHRLAAATVTGFEFVRSHPWRITAYGTLTATISLITGLAALPIATCKVPGVNGLCAIRGWGGVPKRTDTLAWRAAAASGNCERIREYLRMPGEQAYTVEAERVLLAASRRETERWTPEVRRLPVMIRAPLDGAADEDGARSVTLASAAGEAARICRPYASGSEFRLKASRLSEEGRAWSCVPADGGVACSLDGEAVCELEARRIDVTETCRPPQTDS